MSDIVERLRAKQRVYPVTGGGTLSSDGTFQSYVTDDGRRLVNPDGPEAAAEILALPIKDAPK